MSPPLKNAARVRVKKSVLRVSTQIVNLSLNPVKPVKQLRHVGPELSARDVVTRNLFPSPVEQDTQAVELIELTLEEKAHDGHNCAERCVPQHHFHGLTLPRP
jgi:hypothetical protein